MRGIPSSRSRRAASALRSAAPGELSAGGSPRIEVGLARAVRAAVRAPHVADLVAVPRQMQRVRAQQLAFRDLVPAEVAERAPESRQVESGDALAVTCPRRGKAREELGDRSVEV